MPRPTTMTDWWKLVLDQKAQGKVALLATLLGISVRTLHRWQTQDISVPDLQRRKMLQNIVGPELLKHPGCPGWLQFNAPKTAPAVPAKLVQKVARTTEPSLADILRHA